MKTTILLILVTLSLPGVYITGLEHGFKKGEYQGKIEQNIEDQLRYDKVLYDTWKTQIALAKCLNPDTKYFKIFMTDPPPIGNLSNSQCLQVGEESGEIVKKVISCSSY